MKTFLFRILIGLILFFAIGGELVGRYYGLCTVPLYVENPKYEYIHAPNQRMYIYRNKFFTNQYSMRGNSIDVTKDTSVVLFIGDSVINGGNIMDQDSLASTILEKELTKELKKNIRVLNVSAGSWGPDNAAAYFDQYGLFNADFIVLVVSSHDAHDNMAHEKIVGVHPQFPNKQVLFAWEKIIERGRQQIEERYLNKYRSSKINSDLGIGEDSTFNSGFAYFETISKKYDIPLLVYLHCTREELNTGAIMNSGTEIINFCQKDSINVIEELKLQINQSYLRDGIHYNSRGQRFLADQLFPYLVAGFKNEN